MLLTDLFCYIGGVKLIDITICGHNSHHRNPCNIEHPNGCFDYLLLLVKTKAWFYIDKKRIVTEPNMAILFDKNTYIHYGCDQPGYNDDWIHFSITTEERELLSRLLIPLNQPMYPNDIYSISQYVGMLTDIYHSQQAYKKELLDSFMHSVLFRLSGECISSSDLKYSNKYYFSFSALRSKLYNNPSNEWSATCSSNSLDLSISYFQHLYKQFFGLSFQQDIIRARIDYAKFYLKSSNMSIRDLSEFCGYNNELHFMRQFKKWEGMTPSEFRNKYKF